jgi:uncharacterized membrane-anchored protein
MSGNSTGPATRFWLTIGSVAVLAMVTGIVTAATGLPVAAGLLIIALLVAGGVALTLRLLMRRTRR